MVGVNATVQIIVRGLALTVLGIISPVPALDMDVAAQSIAGTVRIHPAIGWDTTVDVTTE